MKLYESNVTQIYILLPFLLLKKLHQMTQATSKVEILKIAKQSLSDLRNC